MRHLKWDDMENTYREINENFIGSVKVKQSLQLLHAVLEGVSFYNNSHPPIT